MYDDKYFFTDSLNLIAWLDAHGFEIVNEYVVNNKKIVYFNRSDELKECIYDFNNDPFIKKFIRAFNKIKYGKKDE